MNANSGVAALIEKEAVRDVILQTALLLDREDLEGWLALFARESEYEISAYSAEIKSAMSWWKSDRSELRKIVTAVSEHVRDPARRMHLVMPASISVNENNAAAVSQFAIFRTTPDGESSLYALGRYEDALVKSDGRWFYSRHRAMLDTRMLEAFTHLPL